MHVALLANVAWLDEELASFQQLVVGLIDEQVRVAQVVPQHLPLEESIVFGERVLWPESKWWAVNVYRLWRMDTKLAELGVDLLHAMDGRLWLGAALLARKLELPVIFQANSHIDLRRLDRVTALLPAKQTAFIATTEPIAQAIRERLTEDHTVACVPPGAHVGEPVRVRQSDDEACAVISGNGRLDHRYHAMLEGLGEVIRRHPRTQFFFDGQGSDQHQIWKAARHHNLMSNLSMIPRRLGHRELLVRADMLLHPQPLGLSRGLTLQAMAHAVPVLAHEDPWLDYLVADESAFVMSSASGPDWAERINAMIEQPQEAESLGQRARSWIGEHRTASQAIAGTLEMYHRMAGHTIPFPG
ncbi:glycosyltransferase family 4 protein [Phycisphaerales bacterium AB-hyl4]|uniref:Glycosyltransferase family 4 protein n=1 Tax=Natronomicrosphaera hydrolytica TaxID=3242702 RepID=A0ABV4U962_9BACT